MATLAEKWMDQGKEKWFQKGKKEGIQEGEENKTWAIIKNGIREGVPIKTIQALTGATINQINKIKEELSNFNKKSND